jgi:O-antigen ligase
MGIVGLLPFLAIAALMIQGVLRAVRRQRDDTAASSLWCSALLIFTSACFGIVLEGPMGAVVFWTILGLAHHSLTAGNEIVEVSDANPPATVEQPSAAIEQR